MSKSICDICKKEYAYKKQHYRMYHLDKYQELYAPSSTQKPVGDSSFQSPKPPTGDKFPELPDHKTISPAKPDKKPQGQIHGLAGFFMTIADWLNATICKDPKVKMDERTAQSLERQFNEAFGTYIGPLAAFIVSIIIIFGWPIFANTLGKKFALGFITKFTNAFKKSGIGDNVRK